MFNEKNIVRLVAFGPLVIIPLVFIILSITIISSQEQHFKSNLNKLKINTIQMQEQKIKIKIDNLVNYLEYKKSTIKQELTSRVKHRVDNAYTIANAIYEKNKNIKSEKEIKDLIKTALGSLTWNSGESFIWMINFKGRLELAPAYLKHLENTSILNTQGLNGKYTIKNEIKICKESKEGFIWDTYTKAGKDNIKQFEQLAFVKSLGFYDLYIGSAEYLNTAKKKSDEVLLATLSKIDSLNTQYLFILKKDGTILLHSAKPSLVGKNAYMDSELQLTNIFKSIFTALKGKQSAFATYSWEHPDTKQLERKISYVRKVPNSDWV
ncbi:cache domain-containing protein, partial [Sulfurimonas sp. SAG-AH-194-C21]